MYAAETILASNLEYLVEPASHCVISSNKRAFWCLEIMALLRSFGSRNTPRYSTTLVGICK